MGRVDHGRRLALWFLALWGGMLGLILLMPAVERWLEIW